MYLGSVAALALLFPARGWGGIDGIYRMYERMLVPVVKYNASPPLSVHLTISSTVLYINIIAH